MKYVIQMQDGTYYMEPGFGAVPRPIFTTSKISEAKLFEGRFDALAVMNLGIRFAGSKIIAFDPEVVHDSSSTV